MLDFLLSNAEPAVIAKSRPLHHAARWGLTDLTKLLLSRLFDPNTVDETGRTPLLVACGSSNPYLELVEEVLRNGADISGRCQKGSGDEDFGEGNTACKSSNHLKP